MVIAALLGTIATAASPRTPESGDLVVKTLDLEVRVDFEDGPVAAGPLAGPQLVCPVRIEARAGSVVSIPSEDCHPYTLFPVKDALEKWTLRTDGRVGVDRLLAELLYVFPGDVAPEDAARLWVVPKAKTRMILTDRAVEHAPISIRAAEFPRYPAVASTDTKSSDCAVRVRIDDDGVPEAIDVTRCDAVFHAPTVEAFQKWSFGAWESAEAPFRVVRFMVRFVRKPSKDGNGVVDSVVVHEPKVVIANYPPKVMVLGDDEVQTPDTVPATPRHRTVPKVPDSVRRTLTQREVCRLDVALDRRGKPTSIDARECPDSLLAVATKTVRKWRWTPASTLDEPVASSTTVALRFDPLPGVAKQP